MTNFPALPSTRSARVAKVAKVAKPCKCGGCGHTTKSEWASGHDGYCTGWAVRVEKGLITLANVPDAFVNGVVSRLMARAAKVAAKVEVAA